MTSYCGYIALIGKPNVGKSTLLNRILRQKLSITSRKPQTTRHSLLGIQTMGDYQYLYVDTPGIHQGEKKILNRMMNKTAKKVLQGVDVIVLIVDGVRWGREEEAILHFIKQAAVPCFLVINKVDKIRDKSSLLPYIEATSLRHAFAKIIPLSAKTGQQVEALEEQLKTYLPEGNHLFADDAYTDRSVRFLCAELVREKLFRFCGQELPYAATVEIELYEDKGDIVHVCALIFVEKENHKRMIIGEKGRKLKEMASASRLDMEKLLGKKVYLQCWCKVKSGWADNEQILKQFGYAD